MPNRLYTIQDLLGVLIQGQPQVSNAQSVLLNQYVPGADTGVITDTGSVADASNSPPYWNQVIWGDFNWN